KDLRTAAGAAAVAALVTASVAGHDPAALGTQWSVGNGRVEGKGLLRIGFGGTQRHSFARFGHGILAAQELRPEPAEDVVHDRFRVRNLLIPSPPARFEADMRKLIDQEL